MRTFFISVNFWLCLAYFLVMTSRFSLCCFLVRMHPYVTMYPNYYPYDDDDDDNNNNNNNNNNNDNDKKAWSAGRWGEGGENRV